ncbi:MAG TPA: hypothetical protein VIJ95_05825 [Hanamia sp.]
MKKFASLLAVITSVILFSSCSKDQNPQPANNANKLKSYTEVVNSTSIGNSTTTFTFGYDNSDRIISITTSLSSGDKFLFTYPSANTFSMDIYVSGSVSIHEDFFLNSNSLMDSTYQYNDTQDTTTEKYFYNSGNQLIKMNEYDYYAPNSVLSNVTNYTYDTNGNVVKSTDSNNEVDTYDYYSDLVNIMPMIIPGQISTKKMNLLKTHTVTSNGYPVGSAISTYTFDSSNRISTIIQTADEGTVDTKTFTYF